MSRKCHSWEFESNASVAVCCIKSLWANFEAVEEWYIKEWQNSFFKWTPELYFRNYVCVWVSGWSSSSRLLEVKILKGKQYCNHDNTMQIDNKSRPEDDVFELVSLLARVLAYVVYVAMGVSAELRSCVSLILFSFSTAVTMDTHCVVTFQGRVMVVRGRRWGRGLVQSSHSQPQAHAHIHPRTHKCFQRRLSCYFIGNKRSSIRPVRSIIQWSGLSCSLRA